MYGPRPAIFDDPELLTLARLKRRGWTYPAIQALLGHPDETQPNPLGADRPHLKLYRATRVEAAEDTPEFRTQQGQPDRYPPCAPTGFMRDVAQREAQDIRERAEQRALRGQWSLPVLSRAELERRVRDEHQRRTGHALTEPGNTKKFNRLSVNYLRHTSTPYERSLSVHTAALHTRRASSDTRQAVLRLVLSAVAHAYPHLRDECERKYRTTRPAGAASGGLRRYRDLPAALREQLQGHDTSRRGVKIRLTTRRTPDRRTLDRSA